MKTFKEIEDNKKLLADSLEKILQGVEGIVEYLEKLEERVEYIELNYKEHEQI